MNILEVIKSSSGSENEVVPIQVITRAQENAAKEKGNKNKKADASSQTGRSNRNTWKARKERMRARRGKGHETLAQELKHTQERLREQIDKSTGTIQEVVLPPLEKPEEIEPRNVSSGGSVLVEKVNEHLDAILQAYDARLKNNQTQEQRWITYPYVELETQRLDMCQKMIQIAQALMEQAASKTREEIVIPPAQEPKK